MNNRKKFLSLGFVFSLFLFSCRKHDSAPAVKNSYTTQWSKLAGGNSDDWGYGTTVTTDGGFVTVGLTWSQNNGDVGVNKGKSDVLAVKYDSTGNKVWSVTLGGNEMDGATSVVRSPDGGVVIAGYTASNNNGDVGPNHAFFFNERSYAISFYDTWIVKLDANGKIVWNTSIGGSGIDMAYAITPSNDGGYIVAGQTNSTNSGDIGKNNGAVGAIWGNDFLVAKIDGNGNKVWVTNLGGAGEDQAYGVVALPDGNIVVSGTTDSDNTGDVGANHGLTDMLVIGLDAQGKKTWSRIFGGDDYENNSSVTLATDGNVVVTGYSKTDNNGDVSSHGVYPHAWLLKLTPDGNKIWSKTYGDSWDDMHAISACAIKEGNGLMVACTTKDDYYTDVYLMSLDQNGNIVWDKGIKSPGKYDAPTAIVATPDKGFAFAGYTNSSNVGDIGQSHGARDFWIMKFQ